jgi:hypothetical protein
MLRQLVLKVIFLVGLGLMVGLPVSAGGWAVVSLDSLPGEVRAGTPLQIGFTVRQHGHKLIGDVSPVLIAHNSETGTEIQVEARQEGGFGHFVAEITFPEAGSWSWEITPRPFPTINKFVPLTVLPPAPAGPMVGRVQAVSWVGLIGLLGLGAYFTESAPQAGAITTTGQIAEQSPGDTSDQARSLFIGKGCLACHYHPDISPAEYPMAAWHNMSDPWTGVDFTSYQASPAYLREWLRDPQSIRPNTVMPNLGLDEAEIEALINFVNTADPDDVS